MKTILFCYLFQILPDYHHGLLNRTVNESSNKSSYDINEYILF